MQKLFLALNLVIACIEFIGGIVELIKFNKILASQEEKVD